MLIMVAGNTASRITGRSQSQSSYANVRSMQRSVAVSRGGYSGSGSGGGGSSTTAPTQPQTLTEVTAQTITPKVQASSYPNVQAIQKSVITSAYYKAGILPSAGSSTGGDTSLPRFNTAGEYFSWVKGHQIIDTKTGQPRDITLQEMGDIIRITHSEIGETYTPYATRRGIKARETIMELAGYQPVSLEPTALNKQLQVSRRTDVPQWYKGWIVPPNIAEDIRLRKAGLLTSGDIRGKIESGEFKPSFEPTTTFNWSNRKDWAETGTALKGIAGSTLGLANLIPKGASYFFYPTMTDKEISMASPSMKAGMFGTGRTTIWARGLGTTPATWGFMNNSFLKGFGASVVKNPLEGIGTGILLATGIGAGQIGVIKGLSYVGAGTRGLKIGTSIYKWGVGGLMAGGYAYSLKRGYQQTKASDGSIGYWAGGEAHKFGGLVIGGALAHKFIVEPYLNPLEERYGLRKPKEARIERPKLDILSESLGVTVFTDLGRGSLQKTRGVLDIKGGENILTGITKDTKTLIGGSGGGSVLPSGGINIDVFSNPPTTPIGEFGTPITRGTQTGFWSFAPKGGAFKKEPYGFSVVERYVRNYPEMQFWDTARASEKGGIELITKKSNLPKQDFFIKTWIFQKENKPDFVQISKTLLVSKKKGFEFNIGFWKEIPELGIRYKTKTPIRFASKTFEYGKLVDKDYGIARLGKEIRQTIPIESELITKEIPAKGIEVIYKKPKFLSFEPITRTKGLLFRKSIALNPPKIAGLFAPSKIEGLEIFEAGGKPLSKGFDMTGWKRSLGKQIPESPERKVYGTPPIERKPTEAEMSKSAFMNRELWKWYMNQGKVSATERLMQEHTRLLPKVIMEQEYTRQLSTKQIPIYRTSTKGMVTETIRQSSIQSSMQRRGILPKVSQIPKITPIRMVRMTQKSRVTSLIKPLQMPVIRSDILPKSITIPRTISRQSTITKSRLDILPRVTTRQTTEYITRQTTDIGRPYVPPFEPPYTPPPEIPLLGGFNPPKGSPIFWGGKRRRKVKHKTRYTPSLSAVLLRIKGKGGGGYTSGLEIRPIPA